MIGGVVANPDVLEGVEKIGDPAAGEWDPNWDKPQ
jgi:hypothetical protein